MLPLSANCIITDSTVAGTFTITDTELYISVVPLSTQDNTKLLQKLKSGFKRTINWNKYQSKVSTQAQKQYLDYFIDPVFKEPAEVLLYHLKKMQSEQNMQDTFFQR